MCNIGREFYRKRCYRVTQIKGPKLRDEMLVSGYEITFALIYYQY